MGVFYHKERAPRENIRRKSGKKEEKVENHRPTRTRLPYARQEMGSRRALASAVCIRLRLNRSYGNTTIWEASDAGRADRVAAESAAQQSPGKTPSATIRRPHHDPEEHCAVRRRRNPFSLHPGALYLGGYASHDSALRHGTSTSTWKKWQSPSSPASTSVQGPDSSAAPRTW